MRRGVRMLRELQHVSNGAAGGDHHEIILAANLPGDGAEIVVKLVAAEIFQAEIGVALLHLVGGSAVQLLAEERGAHIRAAMHGLKTISSLRSRCDDQRCEGQHASKNKMQFHKSPR